MAMAAWSANAASVGSSVSKCLAGRRRLDVERADRAPDRRRPSYRDAGDRLDHELVDAHGLREPRVVAGARGDDRLAGPHDLLGDGPREALVRLVPLARAGRVGRKLALVVRQEDEASLGAEEGNGVVGDLGEQPGQVVLRREARA